jgi:hypothetical protein
MNKKNNVINDPSEIKHIKIPGKKLLFGLLIFIVSILSPLFIPFVIQLNISASLKTIISGLLVFGVPEIGMLLAVAILGKDGFNYLKSLLFFWLKQAVTSTNVGRTRYRIGITLFSATFIIGFLLPYINYFSSTPAYKYQYYLIFTLDFLFFISLFILGGSFWDKLKALFNYDMILDDPKITG